VELTTRAQGDETKIVALTVGASPESFRFRVRRHGELFYDTAITPTYGPYETPREESRLFCGERALVAPPCVRGSAACAPYQPRYGPASATECSSSRRCLDRFGLVACHADADCPHDMACTDTSLAKDFARPLIACQPKKTGQQSLAK